MHRRLCEERLTASAARHFSKRRFVPEGHADGTTEVMLPQLRLTSTPWSDERTAVEAAAFEGLCRSAASDLSTRFFNALPGVRALELVQKALQWGEEQMGPEECTYSGGAEYLYTKGSMSLQGEKGWHDDNNGPGCTTCWQNLGRVPGRELELVVSIRGCFVRIHAPPGKFVHFMAWLPHCTRLVLPVAAEQMEAPETTRVATGNDRLHHSAYVRAGTEYAAIVLHEHKRLCVPLRVRRTRERQ